MAEKKIDDEDKFTKKEFEFLRRLLENKKRTCGWVIDHIDDTVQVEKAKNNIDVVVSVLEKLELLGEEIVK